MKINVHIQRLVLEGIEVPRGQQAALQVAVETELARLLAEGGLGLPGGSLRSVQGGQITGVNGNDPAGLGQQIARAVYGGIGK